LALAKIPVALIDFGERGRKNLGDIDELYKDIKLRGLINPVTVIDKSKAGLDVGNPDLPFLLAAGGRRLTAVHYLEWETVDCHVYDHSLDEYDYRMIELMENLKRKRLTPKEEVDMKEEAHRLSVIRYGEKVTRAPDAPGHSISDTAEMLGLDRGNLSKDLKLKKTMDQFPDVGWDRCKTKNDMHKLANKLTRTVGTMAAAAQVEKTLASNGDSLARLVTNSYHVGDFFDLSEDLPDESFDFVEIDPPYAINLKAIKKGNTCQGYNEIDASEYSDFMSKVFQRCYQKMKPDSWLICWFGPDPWFQVIGDLLAFNGFLTTGLVGCWGKGAEEDEVITGACGQSHQPSNRLANAYELFYYAWKGKPTLARPGTSNLFGCKPVTHSKKWHPTQRPRPLMRWILSTFCQPGAHVLVPFAGSGETLISAFKEKLFPVGFDLESTYKDSFVVEAGKEFS
jgi:DNA modification methylase